jgi:hypothetical protein
MASLISFRVNPASLRQIGRFARRIENGADLLEDRRELLKGVKQEMVQRWRDDFMSEGRGEWAPTSLFQQVRRVREGYSPTPTLFRSGATFNWFDASNRRGRVNAASITWNFANKEGAYIVSHHEGYELGGNEVPSRDLWHLEEYEEEIANDIEEWVAAKLAMI